MSFAGRNRAVIRVSVVDDEGAQQAAITMINATQRMWLAILT